MLCKTQVSIWEVNYLGVYLFSRMPTINLNGVINTFTVRRLQSDVGFDYFTVSHINKDV